jgi:hypothetical protein
MATAGREEMVWSACGDVARETVALAVPAQPATMSTAAEAAIATACRIVTDRLMFI